MIPNLPKLIFPAPAFQGQKHTKIPNSSKKNPWNLYFPGSCLCFPGKSKLIWQSPEPLLMKLGFQRNKKGSKKGSKSSQRGCGAQKLLQEAKTGRVLILFQSYSALSGFFGGWVMVFDKYGRNLAQRSLKMFVLIEWNSLGLVGWGMSLKWDGLEVRRGGENQRKFSFFWLFFGISEPTETQHFNKEPKPSCLRHLNEEISIKNHQKAENSQLIPLFFQAEALKPSYKWLFSFNKDWLMT